MKALALPLALLGWLDVATAFPSYRMGLPLGYHIPCGGDMQGCGKGSSLLNQPESVCNGLGHTNCRGGTDLNSFGEDFKEAGFSWTTELCQKDSDGDGLTNGEELGDPCCKWTRGDTMSPYMADGFVPSHPGDASHTQESYSRPSCESSDTTPTVVAPPMAVWNPHEERKSVDFLIKDYTIPSKHTVYVDFAWNFDDESHDIFHLVFANVVVHQKRHLHHFVLRGCSQKIPPQMEGIKLSRRPWYCEQNMPGSSFWVPGLDMFTQPNNSGIAIGKGVGIVGFTIQVHYTDGHLFPGTKAEDGVTFYYTPNLREYTVRNIFPATIGYNTQMSVPPRKKRWFLTRKCELQVQQDYQVIASWFHAHLIGTEMYMELERNGESIDIGSFPIWFYDDQAYADMRTRNLYVKPGDILQATCVYNSMAKENPTYMAISTTDEMCFTALWIQMKTGNSENFGCKPGPHDYFWDGELEDDETGMGIGQLHPIQSARYLYEPRGGNSGQKVGNLMLLASMQQEVMDRFDTDDDGKLSYEELGVARNLSARGMKTEWTESAFRDVCGTDGGCTMLSLDYTVFGFVPIMRDQVAKELNKKAEGVLREGESCPDAYLPVTDMTGKTTCYGGISWDKSSKTALYPMHKGLSVARVKAICAGQNATIPIPKGHEEADSLLRAAGLGFPIRKYQGIYYAGKVLVDDGDGRDMALKDDGEIVEATDMTFEYAICEKPLECVSPCGTLEEEETQGGLDGEGQQETTASDDDSSASKDDEAGATDPFDDGVDQNNAHAGLHRPALFFSGLLVSASVVATSWSDDA